MYLAVQGVLLVLHDVGASGACPGVVGELRDERSPIWTFKPLPVFLKRSAGQMAELAAGAEYLRQGGWRATVFSPKPAWTLGHWPQDWDSVIISPWFSSYVANIEHRFVNFPLSLLCSEAKIGNELSIITTVKPKLRRLCNTFLS